MSTVFSSAGDPVVARPDVPTGAAVDEDPPPPPPSIEKKFTPVNMLRSAIRMKPPIPIGTIPMPPDPPRMSSILPRFPGVQRMKPPGRHSFALAVPRMRGMRTAEDATRTAVVPSCPADEARDAREQAGIGARGGGLLEDVQRRTDA